MKKCTKEMNMHKSVMSIKKNTKINIWKIKNIVQVRDHGYYTENIEVLFIAFVI